jgi:hypothetical protein
MDATALALMVDGGFASIPFGGQSSSSPRPRLLYSRSDLGGRMMRESSVNWAIEHHHIHLLPASARPSASSSLLHVEHTDEAVGRR